jgi:hypothetical protein
MINKKSLLLSLGLLMTAQIIYSQTWISKPSIPNNEGRGAASSFSIGLKGYYVGGESANGVLTETWEFDTETSNWNQKANYTGSPINKAISFSYNNIGYYGLGWDTVENSQNLKLYTYNPSTDNWSLISVCNLPNVTTWSVSSFCINDKVYFVGSNNIVYYYDITNNVWGLKNNFPGATRFTGIGFEINGKGYIGTGVNSFGNPYLNDLWEYDSATDTWTQKTSMPSVGRYASFGFSYNGKGYVLGGEKNENIVTKEFWEYNPLNNSWTRLTDYISGNRNYLAGFVINNSVYSAFGGLGYNVDFNEYGFFSETASSCSVLNGNLTVGLVGYWPFCGNANDQSSNGNNGTVYGASLTTDRFGNANSAYNFDGISDYISVPNSSGLNITGNQITISMWVYQQNSNSDDLHKGISKGGWDLGNGYELLYRNTYTTDSGAIQLSGARGGLQQSYDINGANSTWIHLVGVFNNGAGNFYVNGQLVSADLKGQTFTNFISNNYPLLFGKRTSGQTISGYVKGKLDDIGIWNRALSQQEITQLYNQNQCMNNITVTDTLIINVGKLSYTNPVSYANNITLYPNPANTQVNISFNNITDLTGGQIKIINSLGQQVATTPITLSGTNTTLALNTWGGKGLYFVQIENAQGQIIDIKKIILQ